MVIGRESERARIAAMLAGARVGESGVLVLTGEAGIGKTALLDAAVSSADGMQVLRATGIEAEREVPFGGLLQLLRPLLHLIDAIPAPQAEALSAALALRAGTAADRFAVGAGTLNLICKAAERRPVALLVDDAHLLDRPSAEALAFAARRLLADPVALLATVRSTEPCALTEAGLPEVQIGALDLASATELIARRRKRAVPAELLDRLHRATGGNPLALLALSADLDLFVRLPPDAPVPVPRAVADAVSRETDRLDGPARTALLVAAASGGDLPLVLRAMGQLGIERTALERAERERLLTISDDRVLFRHPLVRSSVYRAAGPQERRDVHRALFSALPEPDLDRRAWHLAEAVIGPNEDAADLLESAAVLARSRSADAVAATAFSRAATLSADNAGAVRRLVSAGESAWLAGQVRRSRALLEEAQRRAYAPKQRVRAQEVLGAIAARGGSLVEARDLLSAAASEAEAFDPDLAVTLLADAVNACFYLGDSAWSIHAIRRLEEYLAGPVGLRAQILGLMAVGTAQVLAGQGGVDAIRRSVQLLSESDVLDDDPRRMVMLVLGPLFLRESGTGRELVSRVIEESRRRTAIGTLPALLFHLARDDATTNRWSTAAVEYNESIRLARETGQTTELAASLAGLGWLEARQGRTAECLAHLEEAERLCDDHQIHLFRAWCFHGRGELEWCTGSVERALGHFDEMASYLASCGVEDIDLEPGPERVDALLRLGRDAEAEQVAQQYHDRAQAKGQPWALARAERTLAMCASDDDCDARFATALDWHAETLDDFERAKTLLVQGSRLRRRRGRSAARSPLREALRIFDTLGAAPYAELAAVELRATGERSQPRGASILASLTPQELQIATMLADGLSTRETASALFLSPKTVEYHLRHVYTKLDVHTRKDLARTLFR